MTRPDWCPQDVWEAAIKVQYQEPGLCLANSQLEPTARAILAERERAAGVANERVAQLWAAYELLADDDAKSGYAGQMIEALLIEQRLRDGHQPKQSIEIEGLHDLAKGKGFQ